MCNTCHSVRENREHVSETWSLAATVYIHIHLLINSLQRPIHTEQLEDSSVVCATERRKLQTRSYHRWMRIENSFDTLRANCGRERTVYVGPLIMALYSSPPHSPCNRISRQHDKLDSLVTFIASDSPTYPPYHGPNTTPTLTPTPIPRNGRQLVWSSTFLICLNSCKSKLCGPLAHTARHAQRGEVELKLGHSSLLPFHSNQRHRFAIEGERRE